MIYWTTEKSLSVKTFLEKFDLAMMVVSFVFINSFSENCF